MSYRLDLNDPVPDALRAVAVERLERAAERLADTWRGPTQAYADELDTLATLLGDDHDLATLATRCRPVRCRRRRRSTPARRSS